MNSSRQEFICIEKTDPTTIGEYLKRLEGKSWDLRNHNIYVLHSYYSGGYRRISF